MALEVPADQPSVPWPIVMQVRRGMDRDDAAAVADELLERVAAIADQPLQVRLLWIRGATEENDGAKPLQAPGRENGRIFARDDAEAAFAASSLTALIPAGMKSCR